MTNQPEARRIEYVPLSSLKADPANPKAHDVDTVGQSLTRFGVVDLVTIDERTGFIVSGHGRTKTLRKAKKEGHQPPEGVQVDPATGEWLIPVTRGWRSRDEYEAKAALIAMNRTTELGGWVDESLTALLDELRELPEGLLGTGYEDVEVDTEGTPGDPEELPELPEYEPITKLGDVWELGRHRLVVGDSTDPEIFARVTGGRQVDLLVTDPPYGISYDASVKNKSGYGGVEGHYGTSTYSRTGSDTLLGDELTENELEEFLAEALGAAQQVMRPGAAFYIFYASMNASQFFAAAEHAKLEMKQILIWVKPQFVFGRQDYHWQHEPCLYGWKLGAAHTWLGGFQQTTLIDDRPDFDKMTKAELVDYVRNVPTDIIDEKVTRDGHAYHPTAKPVHLIQRLIENSSEEHQHVLDPFGGSGSTLIASELTNRTCSTIELDPRYADAICRRYQTVTGEMPKRDGQPLDFVTKHEQFKEAHRRALEGN